MLFLIFLLIFSSKVEATDFSIRCTENKCDSFSENIFYQGQNLYPGFSDSKNIIVYNDSEQNCSLFFSLSELKENLLSSKINLSIKSETDIFYTGSLEDININTTYPLGKISPKSIKKFTWDFFLPQDTDNQFQQQNSTHQLSFSFKCDQNQDTSCNDKAPEKIISNLQAISTDDSVTLFWDEVDDIYTYHLISFSENPSADTFSSSNIGPKGTSQYTINNLFSGTTYYFKIMIGNGCSIGQFSKIISIKTKEDYLPESSSLPAGFSHNQVLGTQDVDYFPIKEISESSTCLFVFPFVFILSFFINLFFLKNHTLIALSSAIALVTDYYLSRYSCKSTNYIFITPLFSFLLPLIISIKRAQK
ncbi:fibronectin type III domain-containing protein [Candidatus Shapirobacteria bacterium]|nr:fibronectin type III domain-containing protein [Candidatus Shapirobacteria bacterium]